jgi:hypothetical protein
MTKSKVASALALVTTLFGAVSSPVVLGLIPAKWAAVIVALGALWQAVTKALYEPTK